MNDYEQPAAGVALKADWKRLGWFSGLSRKHGFHEQADWLDAFAKAPTDAGGAVSEASERQLLDEAVTACAWAEKALERYDNALGLEVDEAALIAWSKCGEVIRKAAQPSGQPAPKPLQQGGEVTRAIEVIVSEAIFEHRDNPTMCAADVSERASKRILALFASPDLGDLAGLVERLEDKKGLAVCPYDQRSPDYWTTPDDAPCKICGQLNDPAAPDVCKGVDLRVMDEAARALRSLAADRDKAAGLLRDAREHVLSVRDHDTVERINAFLREGEG